MGDYKSGRAYGAIGLPTRVTATDSLRLKFHHNETSRRFITFYYVIPRMKRKLCWQRLDSEKTVKSSLNRRNWILNYDVFAPRSS